MPTLSHEPIWFIVPNAHSGTPCLRACFPVNIFFGCLQHQSEYAVSSHACSIFDSIIWRCLKQMVVVKQFTPRVKIKSYESVNIKKKLIWCLLNTKYKQVWHCPFFGRGLKWFPSVQSGAEGYVRFLLTTNTPVPLQCPYVPESWEPPQTPAELRNYPEMMRTKPFIKKNKQGYR